MTSPARAPRPTPRRPSSAPKPSPRPDLRVAPQPSRRRRTKFWVFGSVLVVFGSLLASAIFYSVLVSGQLHLDSVDRRVEKERAELRRQQAGLADLQSPARIAKAAADRGMVPANPIYWLSPGTGAAPVATGPAAALAPTTTTPATTTPPATAPGATTQATTAPSRRAAAADATTGAGTRTTKATSPSTPTSTPSGSGGAAGR